MPFLATVTDARDTPVEMLCHILVLSLLAGTGVAGLLNADTSSPSSIVGRGQAMTSVVTTLTEGVEWLIPIQIANKTFNVQLDTGSADL